MKKYIFLFLLLLQPWQAFSFEFSDCLNLHPCEWLHGTSLELKGAYYQPTSHLVREMYDTNGMYSIALDKDLGCNWHAWTEVGFMKKNGHSLGLRESTSLRLIPWSFGVKYFYPLFCNVKVYGALGGAITWMHIHNDTGAASIASHVSKQRIGAVAQVGATYDITSRFFLDAFTNYLYLPFELANVSNLGGFTFGGGIGVRF